jgi:hypothetical protein
MNQTNHPLHWYALWTRSRHEKYVRDQLAGKGIEPLRWSNAKTAGKTGPRRSSFPCFPAIVLRVFL